MDEPAVFQITLPRAYAEGLRDALDTAAREAGMAEGFQLDEVDTSASASEMQFDPITVAAGLYVANLVVNSVAGAVVASGLQKLIAKMKADRSGAPARRIALLLPDLSVVYLDPNDAAGVEASLRRLTVKRG